jgi:hypothetical protein
VVTARSGAERFGQIGNEVKETTGCAPCLRCIRVFRQTNLLESAVALSAANVVASFVGVRQEILHVVWFRVVDDFHEGSLLVVDSEYAGKRQSDAGEV